MDKFLKNPRILIVLSTLAILFGSWLIISSPARKAEKSLDSAKQLVADQEQELEKINNEFQDELSWYKSEYALPVTNILFTCQETILQVNNEIQEAEKAGGSRDKRAHAEEAKKLIQLVTQDLSRAMDQILAFTKITADARNLLLQVQDLLPKVSSAQFLSQKLIVQDGPKYLSKYVSLNQAKSDQAQDKLAAATEACQNASDLLPVESSLEKLGDPNSAIGLLKDAEQNLASAKSDVEEIAKNFDFYNEAEIKTASSLAVSRQKISTTLNYLDSVVAKGPLQREKALKEAFENIAKADKILSTAEAVAKTLTDENKYDLPLAYGESLKAFNLADWSNDEANRQVALYAEVTSGLKQLRLAIADLEDGISNSTAYQNQLKNHSVNSWSAVADNIKTAKHNCDTARAMLTGTQNLISVDQAYFTASSQIREALNLLDQSEALVSSLVELTQTLEKYRSNWPHTEREAKRAINNEESNIDSYGSYDSSAQSDFDSAKSYLASAQSSASNKEYRIAVERANQAIQLASGTGDQAYQAYLAYKRRQDAADDFFGSNSSSSSSSDSWGGGFGSGSSSSDSSGWGGSSSSDGGGWGGSSSSDGGGWGGSSSSDGGGWD